MSAAPPRLPSFYRLLAFDSIDSTNEEARRRAAAGAPEGTLVWALQQTAGRGRRGRDWQSPRGNLFASLLLRPVLPAARVAQLGFVAAVALGEALAMLLPDGASIAFKWPNDVLVDGAKVSGILLEAATAPTGAVDWLVLGIGVNIVAAPDGTPYPATSLRRAGAAEATAEATLVALAPPLLDWHRRWLAEGFGPVRTAWLDRAIGLGQPIEVRLDRETVSGRFAALDEGGGLALELPRGGRRIVTTGDIFFPQAG